MNKEISGGYNGRILRVNLTRNEIITESIEENFYRKYLGGAGLIAYYLLKEVEPGISPLSPENKIIFGLGPLTGIPFPGTGRHCVGAKSPLTGGIAKSEAGEFWGAELKFAGFDALIIEGKSEKPVYIWIHDGEASIRDAGHLWGKYTKETQEIIRAELNDKRARVAMIGPGGENLVKYACVMHGTYDAAGRGGMGAVMGSKNLKAIAVRGTRKLRIVNPEGVKALRGWLEENKNLTAGLSAFGTAPIIPIFEKLGNLPTRNFRDGEFPTVENISTQTLKKTIRVGMEGCFACPVRCKKIVEAEEPYKIDRAYGGPEYETIGALGSNCGIDDIKAISKGNELCNAYSIDTISTGMTISFAMECFENGLITAEDTGGIELKFGNSDAMLKVIELIGNREGFGNLLAEGTARAAKKIGKGADAYAINVKKQELPMHEPRLNKSTGLGYMVGPWGADHCSSLIDIFFSGFGKEDEVVIPDTIPLGMPTSQADSIGPQKVSLARIFQFKRLVLDSLGLCMFLPYSIQQVADVTASVTGWDTTPAEQLRVAERIVTMFRLFNAREGFTDKDDVLPKRFFEPTRGGALANRPLNSKAMENAKQYYYSLMGWDEKGTPTPEKLEELGIEQ